MTSPRKRLENILCELEILREAVKNQSRYPPCRLKIYSNGKIGRDAVKPLPEKEFLKECQKCKAQILKLVRQINLKRNEMPKIVS
jgi:hypothetical protein